MFYFIQFIIGGTVMLLASWLSRSNLHFLSGVITLLPILTLLNMRLQMKSMTDETFHLVQQNAIIGAIGMVIFTGFVFYFSGFWKPTQSILYAITIYACFMITGKYLLSFIQNA